MAEPQGEPPFQPLTYKTWVLKVSIHCQGCKRKVNKVLHGVEGVYTIHIDAKQQKVIVTGNVEPETLIRKLIKSGKHAELWPETPIPDQREKKPRRSKKKEKENNADSTSGEEEGEEDDNDGNDNKAPDGETIHTVKVVQENAGKPFATSSGGPGGGDAVLLTESGGNTPQPAANSGAGGGTEKTGGGSKRRKKKKKGPKTVTVVEPSGGGPPTGTAGLPHDNYHGSPPTNLNPQPHYEHRLPPQYHTPAPVYVISHHTAHPTSSPVRSYYAAPSYPSVNHAVPYSASPQPRYSYRHAYVPPEVESPPSDSDYYLRHSSNSFELLSDENPNGCFVM